MLTFLTNVTYACTQVRDYTTYIYLTKIFVYSTLVHYFIFTFFPDVYVIPVIVSIRECGRGRNVGEEV